MNLPGFDEAQLPISDVSFPWVNPKFADCLDDHGWVQLITNPTRGKNVVDLFITNNDSLIVKTQVIPGISDHDAVFFEGNIKATFTKQNAGLFPCIEKHTGMALKNTCLNMKTLSYILLTVICQ